MAGKKSELEWNSPWPGLSRPTGHMDSLQDVDGRDKPGHDD
jgi:hypothetical protein